ncbi:3'-5' exonuclease [Sabulicella glaciei]|uniref:3'-5' exonuclease n=1 Tax=Sabulicella glaciei TaxID=2984948 RepID=UPI00265B3E8F
MALSTVHKTKGREWDSVALASDFPELEALRRRWGQAIDSKDDWAKASLLQEWNILYVAVTRAVRELLLPIPQFEGFGG